MNTTKKDAQPEIKRERVTLRKHHTHAGKACAPGDTIEVLPRQADAMRKRGIID